MFEQAMKDNLFIDLDLHDLWRNSDLYTEPDNNRFFIRPYALSVEELRWHRNRVDDLLKELRNHGSRIVNGNVIRNKPTQFSVS